MSLPPAFSDKVRDSVTRAHEKWVAPIVPMPVDIDDAEAFPEIAMARRFAGANRDRVDADWEIGHE